MSELLPDDDDTKARRNLLAFSAVILLLAWLRLPLVDIADKVGGATAAARLGKEPARLWTATAAILLYLAVRFHFFGGGREAFKKLTEKYNNLVHWDLDARMKAQSNTPDGTWWLSLPSVIDRAREKLAAYPYSGQPGVVFRFQQDTGTNEARWVFTGRATVTIMYVNDMNPPGVIFAHNDDIEYSVPLTSRFRIGARAFWLSWLFSEEAIAWMFPVWLALGAAGIVGFRLGQLAFS